jgi:multidrug efflux pump subunit AcrB
LTSRIAEFVQAHSRALVLVILSFAVAGLVMIPSIPVSILPQTDFPRVVILVDNGIAPINIQMLTVTRPLEEAIRLVPGITTVRSVTGRGSTEINVFFRWDVDILNALHLVQGRIAQITPNLPPGCHFYVNRLTFSVFPIVGFSVTSATRNLADLWELTYYDLAPRLYRLPGVAETRIVGGRKPEYHILVDPAKLNGLSMPITKVVDAIRNSNLIEPAGMVQENYHLYLTTVDGLLGGKEQVEDVVVDVVKGTPILVKDIAQVVAGEEPVYNIVTANGRPAVLVNVLQQPDGNAVQIADAVNQEIKDIRRALPPGIDLSTYYDQSILVRESISGVSESIVIGLLLSVAVLLVFLKDWRTTLVAALVIPIATLIAVVFMKLLVSSLTMRSLWLRTSWFISLWANRPGMRRVPQFRN